MLNGLVLGDIATWVATLVSLLAMWQSIKSSRRAKAEEQKAAKHQEEAAVSQGKAASAQAEATRLIKERYDFDQMAWTDYYFSSVREWANQACTAVSAAIHFHRQPETDEKAKQEILSNLSVLIDTGRWFFPNEWSDKIGLHKEPAYRGLRQKPLDILVFAYNEFDKMKEHDPDSIVTGRQGLVSRQRMFVSEIQMVLNPRQREQRVLRVLEEFKIAERYRSESDQ